MEKTSWIAQHAGICLGAGSQRDFLVDHLKVWGENTRTGVELTLPVPKCVWCAAQTDSRCSAKIRRLLTFEKER